jgi:hypothetical protein
MLNITKNSINKGVYRGNLKKIVSKKAWPGRAIGCYPCLSWAENFDNMLGLS